MVAEAGERKDVAKALSTSATMLGRWIDPKHAHFIPMDDLVLLDEMAGDIFLRDLARMRGFELVPVDRKPIALESALAAAADISKESGELVHNVYEAAKDGICPREARELRSDMGEVFNALHILDQALPA